MDYLDQIMAEAGAFMRSRVVLTAVELDLFTRLHENPVAAEVLAADVLLDERALTRVLDCLITFRLLEKRDGRYVPTERGMVLSSRHPESVLPMIQHLNTLWDNWDKLTETVEKGKNPNLRPVIDAPDMADTRAFIGAMHVVGRRMALEIADYCDLGSFSRLLDIGGGSGTYTIAFLKENPDLSAVLYDLPDVIPMAEERLRREGFLNRVTLVAGDFYHDALPGGSDIALLSAIIHQNSPQENIALLRKVYRALAPGGALIIRDHIMDETRTRPHKGALFAINMLVDTPAGDTYTLDEVRSMLESAGFQRVGLLREGDNMDSLVEARKPKE